MREWLLSYINNSPNRMIRVSDIWNKAEKPAGFSQPQFYDLLYSMEREGLFILRKQTTRALSGSNTRPTYVVKT